MTERRDDLASWGRVVHPTPRCVRAMPWSGSTPVWTPDDAPLLAFGQGRSYGDACLNNGGMIVTTSAMSMALAFDAQTGIIMVEAGMTLEMLLRLAIPHGWFLPVVPGTRYVSVGGAVANDIHGKNHHRRGTFGCHVRRLELLRSDGQRMVCSQHAHSSMFAATIGGLGLTGFITWVEIQLMPIASTTITVDRVKVGSLDDAIDVQTSTDHAHEYSVTWIDTTAPERSIGRGHVIRGDHAENGPLSTASLRRTPRLTVPIEAPNWLLNRATVATFNTLYYHRQLGRRSVFDSDIVPYFWPLDAIARWNNLYGSRGMIQYQFVVPIDARDVIRTTLLRLRQAGIASFLTVLKTFGSIPSPGLLSFPRSGLTLSLDLPNQGAVLLRLLDIIDAMVIEAGGALYPAKDVRMSGRTFRASFPMLDQFEQYRDPQFSSTLWRRLTLEQP